jgi:TatD DNase family protein
MIETDAPYLSPVPLRGTFPNEPAYLIHTARFLADLRGQSLDALIEQTAANTRAFFELEQA